ncbi:MAG: ABC transporter permease [Candidatus Krumholzibacteriia bacterium]
MTADPRFHGSGWRALGELTRARILEFVREPEAVFWVFVFPVLLAVALGIAFRTKPADVTPVAVVTADRGPVADRLRAALEASPALQVHVLDEDAAAFALRKARVDVVVDLSDGPAASGDPAIGYRYDGDRPEGRAAKLVVDDVLQRALGRTDAMTATENAEPSPGSRYIDFLIPGLIGLNLMGSGLWGIGYSIVWARTNKLLKRLAATPMRRSHYLASVALSRLLFLGLEVAAIVGAGRLLFGVRIQGSVADLALAALLGALCFAGIGLLVAARPRTIEAVSGWMNLVQLPMWLLSGSFFSYERFPEAMVPVIRALPLTALNDALRAIVNDGQGLAGAAGPLLIVTGWGLVSFVAAVRLFRWQ